MRSKWVLGLLGVVAVAGLLAIFQVPTVTAAKLTNVSPNPGNSAPNDLVFFLRKSPYGSQETIKLRAYFPNMSSGWQQQRIEIVPNADAGEPCSPQPGNVNPASRYVRVTLKTAGTAAEVYWIPYSNFCQAKIGDNQQGEVPSNRFYALYPLPPKPVANANTDRLQVDITVEYGPSVTGDAGGVRLKVKSDYPGMKIGQLGSGQEAFPVIGTAQSVTGSAQPNIIRIPFGICESQLDNAQIGVYDSDQGGFGGLYVRAQVKNLDNGNILPLINTPGFTYSYGGYTYGSYNDGGKIVTFGNGVDGVGDALFPYGGPANPSPSGGSNSGTQATAFISVPIHRSTRYELIVSNVAPKNTIDLLIPGDAYFGDTPCDDVPNENQTGDRFISLTAQSPPEMTLETGNTATINATVGIENFPEPEEGGWGYNEVAERRAVNMQIAPVQKTYDAQQGNEDTNATANVIKKRLCNDGLQRQTPNCDDLGTYICGGGNGNDTCGNYNWRCLRNNGALGYFTSPSVTQGGISPVPAMCASQFRILCADNVYRPGGNCTDLGTWRCQDGVNRDACGNYHWSCEWTNSAGTVKTNVVGWQPAAPTCRIFQFQCRDSSGNWTNDVFKDYNANETTADNDYCGNKYDCPAPSPQNLVLWDTSFGPSVCRIFRCAHDPDGDARFYWAPGDSPDDQCEIRCSNGAGPYAFNHAIGDENCYQQPKFSFTCNWSDGTVSPAVTVVYGTANYSCPPKTISGSTIGQRLCYVITPSTSLNWSRDGQQVSPTFAPPGMGLKSDGVTPWRYFNWKDVENSAQTCVSWYGAPYFRVFGSDVRVGGGIGTTNNCQTNTGAKIYAWNQDFAGGYAGAGTQYAAMATGTIDGFASGQFSGINGNPNPTAGGGSYGAPGTALSFANSTGVYGGSFGPTAAPGCVEYVTAGTSPTVFTGTLVPLPVVAGVNTTQYIKGDVFINGPISYNPGVGINGLTGYRLVVDGNIYIGKGVSRLDGTYVAVNNSDSSKGNIYTCANGVGDEAQVTLSGCQNQLVINGAMVARNVQLLRDCGSLKYATVDSGTFEAGSSGNLEQCSTSVNHAAEVFNYSPELWLIAARTVKVGGGTDSMRSLPPVL